METVGSIQVVATINTKDYDKGKKHIEKGNDELEGNAKKTSSGFCAAWAGAIGGLVATVAQKGFAMISNSIDGAVKRVDTLNNSTRTFENMGIATTDSKKAMDALQKSIKGMPTPLDGAVRGMTALTATYGDIGKGQKVFSALNNAILGFGGSAAEVDNAITQLSQLPMDGPLDAQTWNSLRNSGITPVLVAMAKDSGKSVAEMKKAFGSGELTVQDFTDRLVKMNEEGGGGLKSLEKIVQDSTNGISTSIANSNTAVTRGAAGIIEAIGTGGIAAAITASGERIEKGLSLIADGILWIKDNSDIAAAGVLGLSAAVSSTFVPALMASIPPMRLWSTHVGLMGLNIAKFAKFAAIPALIGAIVGAIALIAMNPEQASSIFENIVTGAQNLIAQLPSLISSIASFLTTQVPAIFQAIVTAIPPLAAQVIPALAGLFDGIVNFLMANGPSIMQTFSDVVTQGANWLAQNIGKFAAIGTDIIVKLLDSITAALPSLIQAGVEILNTLVGAITKALPIVIQSAVDIISKLVDAITANLPTIIAAAVLILTALLNGIITALPVLLNGALTVIMALANALITNLPMIINAAISLVMALVTGILDNLPMIIQAAVQLLVALVNGLIGALPQLIQAALQLVLGLATALIANLPLIIGAAITLIVALVKGLIQAIPQLVVAAGQLIFAIIGALLGLGWQLLKAGGDLIVSLFNGIVGSVGKIGEGIGQIASKIWDTITNIDLLQAGKDIIKGLWNGISNMAGWIGSKIKGFAGNVLGGIKDFFGIKSPSRVMRDQVGKMLGEGIGIGITKSTMSAVHAAEASSREVLNAFDTTTGFGGGKYELAGNIHKGEYVVPKQYVDQNTGLPNISGGTEYNIQNINISSEVDGDRWLRRLTNNAEIESSGLVPTQRYA